MEKIRISASPVLKSKSKSKSDGRRRLLMPTRIYVNGTLKQRFNYYFKDGNEPIYLLPSQLKRGVVINHDKELRYTNLIQFVKEKLEEVIESELQIKSTLNLDHVKELVNKKIIADFDLEYAGRLNQELVTIKGSGYNYFDKYTVDKRALLIESSSLDKPSVDPAGNIIGDDVDEGDIEMEIIVRDEELKAQAKKVRIEGLATAIRYQKGYYDKENIFELYASIYYDNKIANTYNKIVIRLFEYRHYKNPKEHIRFLNEKWITDFLKFLWNEGYTALSTKNFDPLKFDPNIFENKRREKYGVDNFYKLFEIIKTVTNVFISRGIISPINYSKIEPYDICGAKKGSKGSRVKHNLNFQEFNELFFFEFNEKPLAKYQSIFSNIYDKVTVKVKFTDLEIARDLFCLQTMAGGLRGFRELQTLQFNQHDKTLSFYMDKVDYHMINPLNAYTKIIADRYSYKLPQLRFKNSKNTLEHIYRALLKTVAEVVQLKRVIINKGEKAQIKELFNPYFARKSFSQIMYDEFNFNLENIAMFTGHSFESGRKSILVQNYLDTESPEKKRKLFDKIQVPKEYQKKPRT